MNRNQFALLLITLSFFGGFIHFFNLDHHKQNNYHSGEYREDREYHYGESHHRKENLGEGTRENHGGSHAFRVEDTEDKLPPDLNKEGGHPEHHNLQHLVKGDNDYTIEYDNELKGPAEVNYTLDWATRKDDHLKRPQIPFATDTETSAQVTTQDFNGCGYDRGHMCPSFAMGAFHGRNAQSSTFVCSNILPQTHLNNAGVWNSIERMESDDFAKRFGKVNITDGPVYNLHPTYIKNHIAIPAAFYKIIQRPDGQVICFLVPQISKDPKPEHYLTSLKEVRDLTGLNLLPETSDEEVNKTRTKIW
jgi:endonuclease G, mitochondrial